VTELQPAAWFVPGWEWIALGVVLLAVQVAALLFVLRPPRLERWRELAAVLLVDAVLIVLLRFCVGRMGRLDYSEAFFTWRLWFLAMGVVLVGLPVPLWVLALRLARVTRATAGTMTPLISPRFATALVMWLVGGAATVLMGADSPLWPRPARVVSVEVTLPGLPPALDGVKLAVLADLHTGELTTPAVLRTRLAPLRQIHPDLLLLVGDITYLDAGYQAEAARLLQPYVVPHRSFAVAGNMDSGAGTDTLRGELAKVGLTYLENQHVTVPLRGSQLTLAGLGDAWTDNGDLPRTLAGLSKGQRATTVLLSHTPDILPDAIRDGIGLVLSGHLHGGQIVLPFAGPALGMSRFGTRFTTGTWQEDHTTLVVSRGLGEESLPLRLFCPPEIVVVTLRGR
jgi:uncharacterized protein